MALGPAWQQPVPAAAGNHFTIQVRFHNWHHDVRVHPAEQHGQKRLYIELIYVIMYKFCIHFVVQVGYIWVCSVHSRRTF